MATLFLHVPELEVGISEAEHSLGTIDTNQTELKRAQLMSTLKTMFEFAQTNLQEMLNIIFLYMHLLKNIVNYIY